jgi:translation initiation factor 2B subunit (eIF-2B alpha/beta/delta family)
MNQSDHELLYKLFRDHEDVIGESKTTLLSLESLVTSIKELRCGPQDMQGQVKELFEIIKNSEPKIVPLINLIMSIEHETVKESTYDKASIGEIKEALISLVEKGIVRYKSNVEHIIINGSGLIEDNDFVIVHSASSIVRHSLVKAKLAGKSFKVLILKQDFVKTRQIIRTLNDAEIPYIVIPEHNLVHYIDDTTKVLVGAISVTRDEKFIAAVGTTSVVGTSHLHKIPVYLLVDTLKFSYFISDEQRIHKKVMKEVREDLEYSYIQYSHDKVELMYVDHIITEKGEVSKEDVEKYFRL